MNTRAVSTYRRQSVTCNDAGGVLLMLLDGLEKYCSESQAAFAAGDLPRALVQATHARAVVDELLVSLDRQRAPELCARLAELYTFVSRRLTDAVLQRNPQAVAEAWRALEPVADGFRQAVPRARAEGLLAAQR